MLSNLRLLKPEVIKDLTITATCKEDGQTYYFNAENTPDLDIAVAARASASLPVILKSVKIDKKDLGIYAENVKGNAKHLSFIDGGYLNNIPVNIVQNKQGNVEENKFNKGESGQNLQTLALVFDEVNESELSSDQSAFYKADEKEHMLYDSSKRKEKFIRDFIPKKLCGIKTKNRNTKTKEDGLEVIRTQYTQRNIALRSPLRTSDFKKASAEAVKYIERGEVLAKEFLDNHKGEAVARSFDNIDELKSHLREIGRLDDLEDLERALPKE